MEYNKKYNIYGVNGKYESDYGRNIDHNTISPEQALKDLREDAKRHFIEQRQHLNKRLDIIENALKVLEFLKEKCEFDFLEIRINGELAKYEIHIRPKNKEQLLFNCLALYPKTQEEYDSLKEVLKK